MLLTGKYEIAHFHFFLVILTLTRELRLPNKLRKRTNHGEKSLEDNAIKGRFKWSEKGSGKSYIWSEILVRF